MRQIKGTIQYTHSAETEDYDGNPITLYSFCLVGKDGWYRLGATPVPFGRGTPIQFEVDRKGNVDLTTIKQCSVGVVPGAAPVREVADEDRAEDYE